jgi:TRAP-type mannitol/chloroaromatic compound transport system permease small subunit
MKQLLTLSRGIDAVTTAIGRNVAWLIVAAAVIGAVYAAVRKLFATGSNAWLEIQWWMFAVAFLLAAPWTLKVNEHIRIDIVSSRLTRRSRDIIELIGHVFFLIPSAAMIAYTSWYFFLSSYAQNEQSSNFGGLPQWPIKAIIPVAFALLLLQGLSELIKRIAIMRGDLAGEASPEAHHRPLSGHATPEPGDGPHDVGRGADPR